MSVRPQALQNFAYAIVNDNRWSINAQLVIDGYPYFLYGYLFNKYMQELGLGLTVIVSGQDYPLGAFSADMTMQTLTKPDGQFRLKVTALAPDDNLVNATPDDLGMRLPDGGELNVYFDQTNVIRPDMPAGADESPRKSEKQHRAQRALREEHMAPHEMANIRTVSHMAANGVISYLAGEESSPRKKLDEISYNLTIRNRIHAAVRVINANYLGENGEDVLVRNLFENRTHGGFSANYGTLKEWISAQPDGSHHSGSFEYTKEELEVFEEYAKLLLACSKED